MRILLLRHGIAEDAGPGTGHRDEPRPLTEEGADRMRRAAAGIARLRLGIEEVVTSPLVRCRQTAEIVAAAVGLEAREDARLRPGTELEAVADILSELPGAGCVLFCGHQPDMSGIVAELTGGMAEFRRGSLAVIEAELPRPRAGVLRALYPPAALRALGG